MCEVHLRTGRELSVVIDPCSDNEIRDHVTDFAEHIFGSCAPSESEEFAANPEQSIRLDDANSLANQIRLKPVVLKSFRWIPSRQLMELHYVGMKTAKVRTSVSR